MYTYYLITRTCQIHEIQHLQYASQFCLKLLEAVTQQAQIACLQQLAGTVQHLLGGCILFSEQVQFGQPEVNLDRKSTRLNSSHLVISYAVFCLKQKTV